MSLKILAAVEAGMPKGANWKKVSSKIYIRDGLGICRSCSHFDQSLFPDTVQVGSLEYFDAICNKEVLPCHLIRDTLLTCKSFKLPSTPKKTPLIVRIYRSIINNDWSHLKE